MTVAKYSIAFVLACLLLCSCQEKREFTINPDGSGKLALEAHSKAANDYDELHAIVATLNNSKGVDAWTDATAEFNEGAVSFKGTALFPDINAAIVIGSDGSSGFAPTWTKTGGQASLVLKQNRPRPGTPASAAPTSRPVLTEAQIADQIKTAREQMAPPKDMAADLHKLHLEYVFHLPGTVAEQTNFTATGDRTVSVTVTGDAYLKAMAAIRANDADLREVVLAGMEASQPLKEAKMNRELFGKEANVAAKIKLDAKPQFDYAAAVADARKNYLPMMAKLGLYWEEIPKDMTLRFKSIATCALSGSATPPPGCVPFGTQLPRPALQCRGGFIFRMTDENGKVVLPAPGQDQSLAQNRSTTDYIQIQLPKNLPAGTKTLKEILGAAYYTSGTEKKADLGIESLSEGAKGKAYDARILSVEKKTVDGKDGVNVRIALTLPKNAQYKDVVITFPADSSADKRRNPTGQISRQMPDGTTQLDCTFPGAVTDKPVFTVRVWGDVEEFVVPFQLKDVTLP
jgi:hypothetical protein